MAALNTYTYFCLVPYDKYRFLFVERFFLLRLYQYSGSSSGTYQGSTVHGFQLRAEIQIKSSTVGIFARLFSPVTSFFTSSLLQKDYMQ
jgi:hypothetical protein